MNALTGRTFGLAALAAASVLLAAACDADTGNALIDKDPAPSFSVVHVSGHWGNYADCRSQSLNAQTAGSARFAGEQGDCADPDGCGPSFLNCEHGEVTVQLTNTGTTSLTGLKVSRLDVHYGSETYSSEVLDLTRTDGKPLTDPIAAGTSVQVVIQYRGIDRTASGGTSADASAEQKVSADFEAQETLETYTSPHLDWVPTVAT